MSRRRSSATTVVSLRRDGSRLLIKGGAASHALAVCLDLGLAPRWDKRGGAYFVPAVWRDQLVAGLDERGIDYRLVDPA